LGVDGEAGIVDGTPKIRVLPPKEKGQGGPGLKEPEGKEDLLGPLIIRGTGKEAHTIKAEEQCLSREKAKSLHFN